MSADDMTHCAPSAKPTRTLALSLAGAGEPLLRLEKRLHCAASAVSLRLTLEIRMDVEVLGACRSWAIVASRAGLMRCLSQLTATERLMTGIDFEAIRSRFQIEIPIISGLESSIAHVAASYGSLAESLREISDITRLPAFSSGC